MTTQMSVIHPAPRNKRSRNSFRTRSETISRRKDHINTVCSKVREWLKSAGG